MKIVRIVSIVLFLLIVIAPLVLFNTEPNSISSIDNRKLTENPFRLAGDLTVNIQNYVNDRIGLRDEMITGYTILNDAMFRKMVHPSYTYGKNGYVFGSGLSTTNSFGDYHVAFADMVAEIQAYCVERGVPFLFVFNPAKPAVYQDEIADGVNYNREWVELFFKELEKRNVNYLDNTETLLELRENGIDGFNQKYDANHWNDLGAFYGTQAMLERLDQICDDIHVNSLEEFTVSEKTETSLQVSKFPIRESVPQISLRVSSTSCYEKYASELALDASYRSFGYYVNSSDRVKDTPKALVFQGSYMNSYGYKYLINAFEEYVYVHDYQNVLNFPYYFNIFQPECVIFEVAEYTLADVYFDYEKMKTLDYNPPFSQQKEDCYEALEVAETDITVERGDQLTTLTFKSDAEYSYVWIALDGTYDMERVTGGYRVTIETERYDALQDAIEIYASKG